MVPHRRPAGRRALLPAEVALCESLNLSEADYWHFVELTERYTAERPAGYELIPDAQAGFLVPILINLVIGIALSALGALLAPKPQEQKTPPQARTADIKGQSRFAPQTAFDSVQELASLGAIIPLVFTRKGVRVASSLLWSQMLSFGTGQQLRLMALFSSGELEARPDFAGFAIGDSLLENYVNAKLALYFKTNGGRIAEGGADRYSEGTSQNVDHPDAFSLYWDRSSAFEPYFSGTRTPGTQTQFGVYNPMPNGMAYKVDYEVTIVPSKAEGSIRSDVMTKRAKIGHWFYRSAAITWHQGDKVVYRLMAQSHGDAFSPWGTEDVNAFTEGERIASDDAIAVGDAYLAGTALVVGHDVPVEPWLPGRDKSVVFRITEPGLIETAPVDGAAATFSNLTLQRVALGVVSNNRECTCTEIGLKSTVYKQITGFANVNSFPGYGTIERYERENGSFSLGSLTAYIFRLSFFVLQVRPLGSTAAWQDISDGTLFCVRNNTPQPQYNFIRINHPFGQYEFRLRPYPGNAALKYFRNGKVWQLRPGTLTRYQAGEFLVAFAGTPLYLTDSVMSNSEWNLGAPPPSPTGSVRALSSYSNGDVPRGYWREVERRDGGGNSVSGPILNAYYFYWDRTHIGTVQYVPGQEPVLMHGGYRYLAGRQNVHPAMGGREIIRQSWYEPPRTFNGHTATTGGNGNGLVLQVQVYENGASEWGIVAQGAGYLNGQVVTIPHANVTVAVQTDEVDYVSNNLNIFDAVADVCLYSSERSSHQDGPEHEIVYVNEMVEQQAPQYTNLAIAGLRINSTKEWSSFNSLSAYIKRGCMVERLVASGRGATNLLPEIATALLTDPLLGAGNLISRDQVNLERMTLAAQFCEANGFTWDGVISEKQNIRQWIFEQAGYCLLDFTILGGQFSLVPSVPYGSDFKINPAAKPEIKALFTDGNIKDLRVTFLSPEERKLFKAVLKWRQDKDNGFPQTRVFTVRLADSEGGSDADPEEQFDMSGFCTTQAHPMLFAKYALRTRQKIDHAVQFKTTPQAAMGLAPGEHFRLVSEVTHTSRFSNGTIGPDGTITCVGELPTSAQIIYWAPGSVGVSEAVLTATGNHTPQQELWGTVFSIKNTTTTNRVYKLETLAYSDDGLVDVTASFAPLTDAGSLSVLDWPDSAFRVEVG
jgi:hypothetical protein